MSKKPAPIETDTHSARAVRGPNKHSQWYWRHKGRSGSAIGWATRDEALILLSRMEVQPEEQEDGPVKLETLGELLSAWVAHLPSMVPRLKRKSIIVKRRRCVLMNKHAKNWGIETLQSRDLAKLREMMLDGYHQNTVQINLNELKQAWFWAKREGYIEGPFPYLRTMRRLDTEHGPTPTLADLEQLCPRCRNESERVALRILWATGMRPGELKQLRSDQLQPDGVQILKGKTGPRYVYLAEEMARELSEFTATHNHELLLGPKAKTSVEWIQARLLSSTPFCCKSFRRAAVDKLYSSGIDPSAAAALMGHSIEVAMKSYRRATEADARRAAQAAGLGSCSPPGKIIKFG